MPLPCSARHAAHRARAGLICLIVVALLAVSCGDEVVQPDTSNPVPSLASLSPSTGVFDGPSFLLTLTGSNFVPGSAVIWDGAERATEFVSATEIRATILSSDIASGGLGTEASSRTSATMDTELSAKQLRDTTVQVWVRNPEPGGGTSGALPFLLQTERLVPTLTTLSPNSAVIGSPDLSLDVFGLGFHETSVVQWNGVHMVTTVVSTSHLTAVIPAAHLVAATTADVTVFTPPPGGGTSSALPFSVVPPNPVPAISAISPESVTAGGPDFQLIVDGSEFLPSSQVLWNGASRPTTYVSETMLQASVFSFDVRDGGTAMIAVSNPPPGGGTSSELPLSIENPVPNVTSLSPASAAAGSGPVTVEIQGGGFVSGSVARWNGNDRTTTFASNSHVTVELTAADVLSPGVGAVTVFNPSPAGGTTADVEFTVYRSVAIRANDILFDEITGNLFVSVPSSGGGIGNTLSAIDPDTGTIVSSVFVGSEPNPLARSDDGQYLYVGLDGSSEVRRYVIASATADIQFEVGTDPSFGPLRAEDIEVLPGLPGTIAISTIRPGVSPRHGGVFIYDEGVRRAQGTQSHTGSNRIEASDSATTLYGYNNETTEFGFRKLAVDANGVTQTVVQRDLISGFGVDIAFAGGKVFSTTGVIVDPENLTQLGTLAAQGAMVPDASIGRVFFLGESFSNRDGIVIYDSNTFLKIGEVEIDAVGNSSKRIVRVGSDGVAFIADPDRVVIVRHPALGL